jgi:alkylation response protein AidB-like acyl-CoA dehydrogenase
MFGGNPGRIMAGMSKADDNAFPDAVHAACRELALRADLSERDGPWTSGSIRVLADRGVLAAFVPSDHGGTAASESSLMHTLMEIAASCLTTALALSQWAAAIRIIASGPETARATLLPALARGDTFTTVGISQITTSRQHLGRPVLLARRDAEGWRLDGLCPWVTGADASDTLVTGAATEDGRQLFFVVSTDADGVTIDPPLDMLALSGSRTSAVHLDAVRPAHVIVPPEQKAARTGGLATTALSLGAARAAIAIVAAEAARRFDLEPIGNSLDEELASLVARLEVAARDGIALADRDVLRGDATSLVLRAAQAAVTSSKGAGFVRGHPAERIARESFFFLVWSCPQSVSSALLCEWARVEAP